MTVKIVLPKNKETVSESGVRLQNTGSGTRVFDSSGVELEGILSVKINVSPDSIITATIEIPISEVAYE